MKHKYPNNLWLHTLQGTRLAKNAMLFFGLLFCMFFSSMNVVGQAPDYSHDPIESKDLDFFPVTFADAFSIQQKLNRLIIAVDTHPNGEQYVLTFGNGIKRVGEAGGLVPFIANQNKFLSNALDFAINSDGKFYVATNESNRRFVRVYSSTGAYLSNETLGDGSYGYQANKFKGPIGIAFDKNDNLYVADHYLGNANPSEPSAIKIYKKDATGNYKNNLINQFEKIDGKTLNFPFRLAINSQQQLYVSELGDDEVASIKILQLDAGFNPTEIGEIGGFSSPIGSTGSIVIDKFDNIFVLDFGDDINLPRLLSATDDPNEFEKVFKIVKDGIQNDIFKINVYNPDNTFRGIISEGVDFPIDLTISKCGTLYVNNSIFDGKFGRPIFGFPNPDITIDFDLEVYQRSLGYDTEKPILINCVPEQSGTLTNGEFVLPDYRSLASFTDNCDTDLDITQNPSQGDKINGTETITITAKDNAGNISEECTFQVVIDDEEPTDTTPPVITCPTAISRDNDAGACGAIVTFQPPTITDDSGEQITAVRTDSFALSSGDLFPIGTTILSFSATDSAGNMDECSLTITIADNENPKIECPSSISETVAFGETEKVITYNAPTFSDNCTGETIIQTAGLASGSEFPLGPTINTFRVTDAKGNFADCSFTVTVSQSTDNTPPTITCPADISKNNDIGACGAVVTFQSPTVTDDSGEQITAVRTDGLSFTSGSEFPIGTTILTFKATDSAGNMDSCNLTITIADNENPKISCPSSISETVALGEIEKVINYNAPTYSDNCTGETIIQTAGLASGSEFPLGPTINTFRVTDAKGNFADCSFTVTVSQSTDNTPPTITCPADISKNNDIGACGAIVTFQPPNVTDDSGEQITAVRTDSFDLSSGDLFPVGTTILKFKATDSAGNKDECNLTITIEDTEKPTISCPANISETADIGEIGKVITFADPIPDDNCGVASMIQTAGLASGSKFLIGTTTNTFEVTDANGNTKTCSFTITIAPNVDTEDPEITCPDNVSIDNDAGACGAVVTFQPPTVTDDSGEQITAVRTDSFALSSGDLFPVGTTILSFSATDSAGNMDECSLTITIDDTENPKIECPSPISETVALGEIKKVINYSTPTFSDNCTGESIMQTAGLASGSEFPLGPTINTFRVTDAKGNFADCSFTVTVSQSTDNTPPTITCPADISKNNDIGACGAVVTFQPPNVTDDSGEQITAVRTDSFALSSGDLFPVGTTILTFSATDSAGNMDECSLTITIDDTENPKIECPSPISETVALGEIKKVINYNAPTYSDNCTGETIMQTAGLTSGSEFPLGPTINTFRVTDAKGNFADCSFTVTVSQSTDNTPPTITCPADISKNNDTGACGAIVTFQPPTITDDSGEQITAVRTDSFALNSGDLFPVGTTIISFSATDSAGNMDECSLTITIADNENPKIECPSPISETVALGEIKKVVNYNAPTFSDNCTGETIIQTAGLASGSEFPLGPTINTFRVTDAKGNFVDCSFTVTVSQSTDNTPPTITCPADISKNNDIGACGAIVTFQPPNVTDDSGEQITAERTDGFSYTSGSEFPIGTTILTFKATDSAGNMDECSLTITIADNENPKIECPSPISETVALGEINKVINYNAPTFSDNCTGETIIQTAGLASGSEFPLGPTVNTFRVTDAKGNFADCSFTVTVSQSTDNTPPTITCPADISKNNDIGACGAIVTFQPPTVTDDSEEQITAVRTDNFGLSSGDLFPVGTTILSFSATDSAGNMDECSLTITIADNENPKISCSSPISETVALGEIKKVINYNAPTFSDNCTGETIIQTAGLASGSEFPLGPTINTFRVTDGKGNFVDCSFTVTVSQSTDNTPPTITCPADISKNNDIGACGAIVTFQPPTVTDDSGEQITAVRTDSFSYRSGDLFPIGTTILSFSATDSAGNMDECSLTITIEDTENPKIECPSPISETVALGEIKKVINYNAPAFSDNCTGETIIQTAGLASGSEFPLGPTVNTFRVTDAKGNFADCSFTVTVSQSTDNTPPTITCPADISKNNDIGACGAIVTFQPPTVNDDFGEQITVVRTDGFALSSGDLFPVGTTILTFSATDSAGNMDECSLTITIIDNEKPIKITCPIDQKGTLTNGKFKLLDYRSLTKFEDNCDEDLVLTQTPNVGSEITQTQVITITAKDDAGNISEKCTFQVVIEDEEPTDTIPPTITCPDDIAINTGSGSAACGAVVIFGNPSASDNSGNVDVRLISNLPSGSEFPVGISTVTFEAKDAAGNTSFCSFEISVNDNTPPAVICPRDILVQYTTVKTYEVPDFSLLSSGLDNCSTTLSYSQTPAIGTVVTENTTVKLRVADEQGNSIRCLVEIKFIDNTELQILNCPGAQTFEVDGNCSYLIPDIAATINTNIEGAEVTQNITPGIDAKNSLPLTITAKFEGQEDTCEIQLIAKDSIDPIVTCPGTQNEIYNPENGFALPNYSLLVQTTDNCTVAKIEQFPEVGTLIFADTEVTVRVEDLFGNFDTCTFDVVLTADSTGNTRPVAVNNEYSTPKNQPLDVQAPGVLGNDIDEGVLTAIIRDQPTNGNISLNSDGSFFYIPFNDFTGEDFFTYIANNGSENSNPATVTITVTPTSDNIVDCKDSFTLELDANGTAVLNPNDLFISRPANLQSSVSQQTFTCSDLGENTVTLSYSNSEITDSCEVRIIVKDELDPIVKLIDISVPLNEFGSVTITPEMLDNGTFDNCGNLSFSLSKSTFGCKDLGENTVTFTATDSSGNESVSTTTVTITGDCGFKPEPDIEHTFIYPNPTSGPFQFATPSGVTIQRVEAFDFRGRMILFKDYSAADLQYNMDLSGVQNAVYVLKLFTSEGIDILRVIIED